MEDSLFREAAHLVVNEQQASASLLQRKFKIGYNRASRIIDNLEEWEVIGKIEGSTEFTVNFNSAEDVDIHCADILVSQLTEEREKDDVDVEKEIVDFLTEKIGKKYSVGDLHQVLDYHTIDEDRIRGVANQLYFDEKILRDGNHKYYIEDKTEGKTEDKIEDIKAELSKFKDLLDSGLITQEDYDKKKNELLGF